MKITQVNVGTATHPASIRDSDGSSLLPIQAEIVSGSPTFRVLGKVSPEAPWVEVIAPGTTAFLQAVSWTPFLQLEITSGSGTVNLYIAEK